MEMKILKLDISNIKGIKNKSLSFDGESCEIYGENATGKTTVYDAVSWLLTGKSSNDSADFSIKPVDMKGEKIIGAIPEVIGVFEVDGGEVILQKRLDEVWKKKAGETESSYDGDTVSAFIDGVPRKIEKEYNEYIRSLADETILKIGLYHNFFMEMNYKDKRNILLSMTNINPDEELKKQEQFSNIENILKGQSIEDAQKRIQEEKRSTKKEYEGIPARVDELKRTVATIDERDIAKATKELESLKLKKDKVNTAIASLQKGGSRQSELNIRLLSLKKGREEYAYQTTAMYNKKLNDVGGKIQNLKFRESQLVSHIAQYELDLKETQLSIADVESDLIGSRAEWTTEAEKELVYHEDVCPYCKQDLPEAMAKADKEKTEEAFIAEKNKKLESIAHRGKRLKERLEGLQKSVLADAKEIESLEEEYKKVVAEIAPLEKEKEALLLQEPNLDNDPKYVQFAGDIEEVENQLKEFSIEEELKALQGQLSQLSEEEMEVQKIFTQLEITKKTGARISELKDSYKEIGRQLLAIEHDLSVLDVFNSERCRLLEEEINLHFKSIKWKLFEIQKNGGVKDVCIATVEGVDYADLNNASKINAGIEASGVITKANNASVPMFVDNAESVIDAEKTEGQMIFLTVSKKKDLELKKLNKEIRLWAV